MTALLAHFASLLRNAPTRAAAFIFFVNGFVFANWVVRIPSVKAELAIREGTLGLALLFMAIGAIITMPLGGALVARIGSARVAIGTGLAYSLLYWMPGAATSAIWLGAALFVVGACNGMMDVAMNAQADAVERATGLRLMSFCHAMFSLGLAGGTIPAGILAAQGVDPGLHLFIVGAPMALGLLIVARRTVADAPSDAPDAPAFAWPRGPLLALGLICFCGAIAEGSMNDWITVYVQSSLGFGAATAAVVFGAFSLAMLVARLLGDVVTDRLGSVLAVRGGLLLAALGVAGAMTGWLPAVIIGFAAVGLGVAGVFPAVFRAAGRMPGHPPGPSMAAAVTLGYAGFLFGPPLIGFVAEASDLGLALGVIIPLCLIGAALAGALRVADA
ncbi:MAG: MFS transporter [Pseudomonadota bacterium]